ncbi:hypothetical protein CASFOL_030615 [Castilleja foliolosa]|uniref:Ribosomal RNA-processing protein 14/surfeit locus protein 6 C-terminal domain-containing protein n=1 Tax=Castilleja foliolosa TaxID=1961234 RepID=A0ABD3C5U5_9LAMI
MLRRSAISTTATSMKKKKQRPTPITAASTAFPSDSDLQSIIHSHGEFLDQLVELIPARFYISSDPDSKPWVQGLSKAARASLKLQSKKNLKLARRQRFDPDGEPFSTVGATLTDGGNHSNIENGDDSRPNPVDIEEKSVTYEELRAKLRKKIEMLRGNRGEKKTYERKSNYDWNNKRKRDGESDGGESQKGANSGNSDDEEIIEYGKVRLGDEEEGKNVPKKKKKTMSKAKELEIAKKKQEAKKEDPGVAERESWIAATSRAMGMKVHDDARLIKESIKKEKKRKEKNAGKWKERVETQGKMKDDRQRKRSENIAGRINEKKQRKIAKREKKLMRPGFEGRKDGFITKY